MSIAVYVLTTLPDQEWAVPANVGDNDVLATFDGRGRALGWRPLAFRLLTRDEQGRAQKYSDFPWYGEHAPVLRARAADALRPLLSSYGELLPLACDDAELEVLNVTRVVSALDLERSEVVRFQSSGRVMAIESYAFHPEAVQGVQVFKIPDLRSSPVFFAEDVVDYIRAAGLEGVGFTCVWKNAETPGATGPSSGARSSSSGRR